MRETADQLVERAHASLRGHTRGELRFDEHVRPVKYIVCPDGRLALPVMVAMLRTIDTVVFVPACEDGALELQVTLEAFDEHGTDGATADRWRIHHGQPDDVRWAYATIDAAKIDGHVIDGEALMRSNPLAEAEPALCRRINESRADDLKAMCVHFTQVQVHEPVLVGVDPGGFDVRGRFDVHRLPAPRPIESADEAMSIFDAMAAEATGAGPA